MLSRRTFLKTSLACFATAYLAPFALWAGQLQQYESEFIRHRRTGKRQSLSQKQSLSIRDFGAQGDGKQDDTKALQSAIDKASALEHGGRVVVPAGVYLIGAVQLKSGVDLVLEQDATLLGSVDISQYHDAKGKLQALLYADHASQISISGAGTIDGRGRELALAINELHHSGQRVEADFNHWRNRSNQRPSILAFYHCQQLKIYDISIKNGASWVQHYAACTDLHIDNIKVDSDSFWNNDGIDINDCKKVQITGCFINSADDAICLKSTMGPGQFNEDIYIADCVLRSSANGVKFGTESQGGFRKVRIKNIKVFDTYRSAIALETVDGAFLEDVEVDGVHASHVGCAIFIRLGQRNMLVAKDTAVGVLRRVQIKNVSATIAFDRADLDYEVRGPALNAFFNPIPASITGLPDARLQDIQLENIEISYPGRANKGLAYRPYHQLFLVPQERESYPEYTMFGELPAWGLYVRHVEGLKIKGVKLSTRAKDFRPALVFDDVIGLQLQQSSLTGDNRPIVVMQQVPAPQFSELWGQNGSGEKVALTAADMQLVSSHQNIK
ncbi:glycoside hydrolase family 28 protein [Rheinheimera sediminis]|uniref:glycoside hydrolase family 28 protein n=1 Tax=Rheinheimera sp. YQF-1 TaxID=2499626 RepID=UPI000FDB5C3D|nr:glycosyl hydrolase family 28 protein [Rheinheimera sp. YQF-1]RVT40544.1 glycoside hydrolase family 28 protein [Rheinheimera sp. YQF-1]